MNYEESVQAFLQSLRRRGFSPRTISAYEFDLEKFGDYINTMLEKPLNSVQVETIDRNLILGWVDSCLDAGNTTRTISRKLAACKSLFRFLEGEGSVKENPVLRVSLPKIRKNPPSALSQDEIRQLLSAPYSDDPYFHRDRAILLLLYSSGLRVSELVGLKLENVLLDRQTVRIFGKGAKERILPLTDTCRKAVLDYFLEREKKFPKHQDPRSPVFLTHKGAPITVRMVQYMVAKYGLKAGIPMHIHPHLIRHSIATHLIEEGCSVEAVRHTLGHESLATTSIYVKASSKFLHEEHKKYNPSDRLSG